MCLRVFVCFFSEAGDEMEDHDLGGTNRAEIMTSSLSLSMCFCVCVFFCVRKEMRERWLWFETQKGFQSFGWWNSSAYT